MLHVNKTTEGMNNMNKIIQRMKRNVLFGKDNLGKKELTTS